ncbi:MAG: GNAT family N-acetyltransferase, partial [Candidatus Lokiarchaeota archaeon]|nr:GNAT family N-acetyltransferase [Candidatus Lokiarchaeota archaeon]
MEGHNHKQIALDKTVYRKLSKDNIQSIYQLFENNSRFFSIPFDYFQRGTLEDDGLDYDLSLVLFNLETNKPISAFIVVKRNEISESYCFFKGCVVDNQYRRQGLGSKMFYEFLKRAKEKKITQVIYGPSVPEFWQPGVDIRNTSLYFFLKKQRFKSQKAIFNLTVSLDIIKKEPASKMEGYEYGRVQ